MSEHGSAKRSRTSLLDDREILLAACRIRLRELKRQDYHKYAPADSVRIIEDNGKHRTVTTTIVNRGKRCKLAKRRPENLKEQLETTFFSRAKPALIALRYCCLCQRWSHAAQCVKELLSRPKSWKLGLQALLQIAPHLLQDDSFNCRKLFVDLMANRMRHTDMYTALYNVCCYLLQRDKSLKTVEDVITQPELELRICECALQFANTQSSFKMDGMQFAICFERWKVSKLPVPELSDVFTQLMNNDNRSKIMDSYIVAMAEYLDWSEKTALLNSMLFNYSKEVPDHPNAWLYLFSFCVNGDEELALPILQRFSELRPDHPLVLEYFSMAFGRKDFDRVRLIDQIMEFVDFHTTKNSRKAWKLLSNALLSLSELPQELEQIVSDWTEKRRFYWISYHFVAEESDVTKVLRAKCLVSIALMGIKGNRFGTKNLHLLDKSCVGKILECREAAGHREDKRHKS